MMSWSFQLGSAIGVPVMRMRLAPGRSHAHAVGDALLELVGELVHHLRVARHVVVEGDLRGEQRVLAADGRGRRRARGGDALQRAALVVDLLDGRLERLGGQGLAGELLDLAAELVELGAVERDVLRALHLRKLHDVDVVHLAEQLVGLLLAVARGLADDQVRLLDVGADAGELEAHERLDERAGVARHDALDLVVAELGAGAQADAPGAGRADDLLGHVEAERADDLAAGGAEVVQLLDAQAVDLAHHEVEVAHALGAVLLRQERVPVHLPDGAEQRVVGGQVEAELLPHRMVVNNRGFLSHARPPSCARWHAR